MNSPFYTDGFYDRNRIWSKSGAEVIVPILMDLVAPKSVVDVGCGVGEWLTCFRNQGVEKLLGIDGDYVPKDQLAIPVQLFRPANLIDLLKTDEPIEQSFDLALCLEVAEHIPSRFSKGLVRFLTSLAPLVLFSAAVPGQKGCNHINCQWPPYWAQLFLERQYTILDPIRKAIWKNVSVPWWYRQNIFLFCSDDYLLSHPEISAECRYDVRKDLTVLHPSIAWPAEPALRDIPNLVMSAMKNSVGRRVRKALKAAKVI